MSEIKVNKISPKQTCTQLTLGDSGDTIIIPAGATITNNGTATGFGATGAVNWDTTKKTSGFTAVSGVGYFCDTTSSAFTATLPLSPSAGDIIALSDYTGTWGTNNLTVGRNSSNINGAAADLSLNQNNTTATLIYVDATEGWRVIDTGSLLSVNAPEYVVATGGTVTCCGDYKIHTFTGPGTFTVTSAGNSLGSNSVDYLLVAGGGGGGGSTNPGGGAGGGGAGGFRESVPSPAAWTASPLANPGGALPVSATTYPITVGAGGAGMASAGSGASFGNDSVFSTITAFRGGYGGGNGPGIPSPYQNQPWQPGGKPKQAGGNGGSGGGANYQGPGGTGNTPPASPPQGNNGGDGAGSPEYAGAGGGGAGAAGTGSTPTNAGVGGNGVASSITGSPVTRAGGGGGAKSNPGTTPGGSGGGGNGVGGGGPGTAGAANTGGGGGAGGSPLSAAGAAGGSGIVIIRYKFQ